MALVICPECGKDDVSDSAVACPNCGYNVKKYYTKIRRNHRKLSNNNKYNDYEFELSEQHITLGNKNSFFKKHFNYLIIALVITASITTSAAIVIAINRKNNTMIENTPSISSSDNMTAFIQNIAQQTTPPKQTIAATPRPTPKPTPSPKDLLDRGDYEQAYIISNASEKTVITAENSAALVSVDIIDHLKNPMSFYLRDVYYSNMDNENRAIGLHANATNGFGGSVDTYWLYLWNIEEKNWEYFGSATDLTTKDYNMPKDIVKGWEKFTSFATQNLILEMISSGYSLDKASIKRINNMFKNDELDQVEKISVLNN